MLKKIKYIFYLFSPITFIILISIYYFSDQNVKNTNKSRSLYSSEFFKDIKNLPLLKNDTENIVEYRDDVEIYKKKKKKFTFFDLIGK